MYGFSLLRYLLLAYRSYIRVYNISTSLLIRTLHAAAKGTVTSAAFSENDQGQLFLALDSGLIERWNWLDGKRLAQWDLKFPIHRLVTTKMSLAGAAGDVILTADRLGTEWNITAHKIPSERKKGTPGLQTVYTTQHPITSMQALNVGEIIVAATATSLLVGTTSAVETDLLQSISYHWHVIPCPENIAVFDARVSHDKSSSSKKPCLDVAIGTANGVIFVYRDLLRTLSQKEHHKAPTAKRLHWHRQAVGAIKWSEDGMSLSHLREIMTDS